MTNPASTYIGDPPSHAELSELKAIRHHLHQHPELGFKEVSTAAKVAELLELWGYTVTREVGCTGIVGTLRKGTSQRAIMLRADMDALPMQENTGLPYESVNAGTMHACGHDGHTAMLLGGAREIAQKGQFDGTVHVLFQPAEEVGVNSGAQRMIADGLFDRFPCDAIFGIHNHPGIPVGTFGVRPGPFMASSDAFFVTVRGKGAHAARPNQSIDPVLTGCSMVVALQSIVSRNVAPTESAVLTVGAFHAGSAPNIIPETSEFKISVRTFSEDVRNLMVQRVITVLESQAACYGAEVEIIHRPGYPVLINSQCESELVLDVAAETMGADHIIQDFPQVTGSEDFAFYLKERPGCFIRLGNGTESAPLHNNKYDFNDENLWVGALFWTNLVRRFLPT